MSEPITYDVGHPPRSLSEFSDGIKKQLAFLGGFSSDEPVGHCGSVLMPSGKGVQKVTLGPSSPIWECKKWFLEALEEFDLDEWFDQLGEKQLADPNTVGELRRAMKFSLKLIDIVASKVTHKGKSRTYPKGKTRSGKRGRKPDTDSEADRQIAEGWRKSGYKYYHEYAQKEGLTPDQVRKALDHHRHQ